LILTASACLTGAVSGDISFGGPSGTTRSFRLSAPLFLFVDNPFALVKVDGDPGRLYPTGRLAAQPATVNTPVTLISYQGENAVMSHCVVTSVNLQGLSHSCETLPGSAGSPLLAEDGITVIGMHFQRDPQGRGIAASSAAIAKMLADSGVDLNNRPVDVALPPTVTFDSISFTTMDEDKDDDTYLSVKIRNRDTGLEIASYDQASPTKERFPDRSTTTKALQGARVANFTDLTNLNIDLRVLPNGNDTWRFSFVLKGTRSNGEPYVMESGAIELSQQRPSITIPLKQ
jgi:hypothetical protein